MWIIFGTGEVDKTILSDFEFCVSQHIESHTLLVVVFDFLSVLCTFIVPLVEVWYVRSECNAVEHV